MISINFQLHNLATYIDVLFCTESFKKVVGLSFSKLSFKLAHVYILTQSSSDMLNKNTLQGCKKSVRPIRSSPTYSTAQV